jgi:hypothetical protein
LLSSATRLAVGASDAEAGVVMKLFVVAAFLLASLAVSVPAQSTVPPPTTAQEEGSKQDKKDQKAKTKTQKKTSKPAKADAGKKTSSTQDAAYASAYKAGIPK